MVSIAIRVNDKNTSELREYSYHDFIAEAIRHGRKYNHTLSVCKARFAVKTLRLKNGIEFNNVGVAYYNPFIIVDTGVILRAYDISSVDELFDIIPLMDNEMPTEMQYDYLLKRYSEIGEQIFNGTLIEDV